MHEYHLKLHTFVLFVLVAVFQIPLALEYFTVESATFT